MFKVLYSLLLVLAFQTSNLNAEVKMIETFKEFKNFLDKYKNAKLIDARKIKKGDDIIRGAIVIPSKSRIKTIENKLKEHNISKESEIIIYCQSPKCNASNKLAKRLEKHGYKNITEFSGGIEDVRKHQKDMIEKYS